METHYFPCRDPGFMHSYLNTLSSQPRAEVWKVQKELAYAILVLLSTH